MYALIQLITNPATLSLLVGACLGIFSQFQFPAFISALFSYYLIFTVGFKGGSCLGIAYECTPPLITLAVIGAIIGFLQTFINYALIRFIPNIDRQTRIVLASQYGSISIVTFVTGISFLADRGIRFDAFMSAIAGIMEIPALFSGLFLLFKDGVEKRTSFITQLQKITVSIFSCPRINLLFIGFLAGYFVQHWNMPMLSSWIIAPFTAILVLFMIDIGIKIARQREHLAHFSVPLILFGTAVPLINGLIGLWIARYWVTYFGSAILFALLLASASYIAVPAVMNSYAPKAKAAIYLPMALGITLPFNIIFA